MSEQLQYSPEFLKKRILGLINESIQFFFQHLAEKPSVLEIGTRRWSEKPTHHRDIFHEPSEYLMVDFMKGLDVDQVVDAHKLSETLGTNRFDAVWSSSTWEHLHSPWIASVEVLKVLKPGGVFFIQTHQTFPIHGYPNDYFRFTDEAMKHLFKNALKCVTSYEYPSKIVPVPAIEPWDPSAANYLNVCIAGIK